MKFPKIISYLVLLSTAGLALAEREVTPTIVARSQGRNAVDKVAGMVDKVHLFDEGRYVNIDATVGYSQTFKANKIARALFGDDVTNCGSILVQGSSVTDRDPNAWLADYFYLAPDYNSSFCIKPKIENFLADLQIYVGLDNILEGLYFRAQGPINYTRWNLNFNEDCTVETSEGFRAGYFNSQGMSNAQLLETFGDYAQGMAPRGVSKTNDEGDIGVSFQPLEFAKIEHCARHRAGFADLRMELGYNFFQSENGHFGLNVQVVAPTGSHREAEFAFDAVVGNGNHWEVGGGLTAHYVFWKSQDDDKSGGFYLDASLTHMNNAREQRTFDLNNRPNSRYMLAQKMGRPVTRLYASEDIAATQADTIPVAQFKGVFAPVANLTTIDVNVAVGVQADIVAMFNYTSRNWRVDLGYNFWGKSCEKIAIDNSPGSNCCPNLCNDQINTWALKGDAQVFGFINGGADVGTLSATECGATIHSGTNATAVDASLTNPALQNGGVDNAQFSSNVPDVSASFLVWTPGAALTTDAIKTSFEPLFINCCDIDFKRTKAISNKVFANVNYTWEKDGWTPYFGIGASAEFASNSSNDCEVSTPDCSVACNPTACCETKSDCLSFAVSQWSAWIKGGLNFN